MQKKIKKKNKKMYFDQSVEDAIIQYNLEENPRVRNEIYSKRIAYAIDKLVENIINTFKFSYFDSHFNDIKQEVISFIILNMHKYNSDKGFKAFSYFSVVAKNYLIFHNNNNYKNMKIHDSIDNRKIIKNKSTIIDDTVGGNEYKEFISQFIMFFEKKGNIIFKKKKDLIIMYSILDLLGGIDKIENFNKKSIYLLIREMTGVKTSEITKILNVMKKHYVKLGREFNSTGDIFAMI